MNDVNKLYFSTLGHSLHSKFLKSLNHILKEAKVKEKVHYVLKYSLYCMKESFIMQKFSTLYDV